MRGAAPRPGNSTPKPEIYTGLNQEHNGAILGCTSGRRGGIIANVNRGLPNNISRNLLLWTSVFLATLALSAIFIEGPLVSLPLKHLNGDLRDETTLLTESQRNRIAGMESVSSTRSRVRLMRFVVPGLYLTAAILIVLFGNPAAYK